MSRHILTQVATTTVYIVSKHLITGLLLCRTVCSLVRYHRCSSRLFTNRRILCSAASWWSTECLSVVEEAHHDSLRLLQRRYILDQIIWTSVNILKSIKACWPFRRHRYSSRSFTKHQISFAVTNWCTTTNAAFKRHTLRQFSTAITLIGSNFSKSTW